MNQKCTQTAGTAKGHTFDQSPDESGAVYASAVAALCCKHVVERYNLNRVFREKLFKALDGLDYQVNGDNTRSVPNAANISFSGLNSEAIMLALKSVVAISNGSACTSQSYEPSHVLRAMGLPDSRINSAVRFSWCHLTAEPDWAAFRTAIMTLL